MSTLVAIRNPYPFHNICDGQDTTLIERTEAAFNLVCCLSHPTFRPL